EVIGGDTEYCEELTVTGTVVGLSNNKELILRKNAKPGDLLCVTGNVGSAGVALAVLLNQIQANASESFLKNLTEPFPRIFEGKMLAESGAVNSMIDTSDGLASSIYELSTLSGVFFEIDEQNLPLDGEALEIISSYLKNENDVDNQEQNKKRTQEQNQEQEQKQNQGRICEKAYAALVNEALYTGGDFELLFTISPDKLSLIEDQFSHFNQNFANCFNVLPSSGKSGRFPCKFTVIGKAIAEKENVILRHTGYGQKRQPLLKNGYDSFTKLYMI
ncbi:MAG: AIR synthase-related protein, partial [Methanimicrococcus sp.]|nr:AIR synthase-related protein [Methanimicrococcus sp.]